jgi:hypothetical protein
MVVLEPQPDPNDPATDHAYQRLYAVGRQTVSCWHFEREQFPDSDTVLAALGQQGTLKNGARGAPGHIGRALLLGAGADAYVEAAPSPHVDGIREGVYIDAYVRPDPAALSVNDLLPIVSKPDDAGQSPFSLALGYADRTPTQDFFWLQGRVRTASGTIEARTEAILLAGEWTHVGLSYEREGPGIVLRVNGREVDLKSSTTGSGPLVQNAAPLLIGKEGGSCFEGRIDELKVASLIAEEVYEFPKNTEVWADTANTEGRIYFDDEGRLDPRKHRGRTVRFRVLSPKEKLRRVVQVNWLGGVEVLAVERDVDPAASPP